MKKTLFLFWVLGLQMAAAESIQCPNLLLEIGFDGEVKAGSKAALSAASQRGEPIRVGWSLDFDKDAAADLAHWSDARFLSILDGEVYTQVQSVHRQIPVIDDARVDLAGAFDHWHGLIGTDGVLQGRFEGSARVWRRNVKSIWCSAAPAAPVWTAVYQNGLNGEALAGSKQRLFDAIRAGEPIRIGWGLSRETDSGRRSVEHVVAPVFTTIVNNKDLIAQLPEHIAQRSYWDAGRALFDDGSVMWRGLVSTTGSFDAVWVNRATGETVRRSPQRGAFTWYVLQGAARSPASLAIPKGVILDQARSAERIPRQ